MSLEKKIYLVDSENVGDSWVELLSGVTPQDKILVFYTDRSPHMKVERVRMLMELAAGRVDWIRCFEGNNALDFQLVTELGTLIADKVADEYVIVSRDRGFEAVVHYWGQKHVKVTQNTRPQVPLAKEKEVPAEVIEPAEAADAAETPVAEAPAEPESVKEKPARGKRSWKRSERNAADEASAAEKADAEVAPAAPVVAPAAAETAPEAEQPAEVPEVVPAAEESIEVPVVAEPAIAEPAAQPEETPEEASEKKETRSKRNTERRTRSKRGSRKNRENEEEIEAAAAPALEEAPAAQEAPEQEPEAQPEKPKAKKKQSEKKKSEKQQSERLSSKAEGSAADFIRELYKEQPISDAQVEDIILYFKDSLIEGFQELYLKFIKKFGQKAGVAYYRILKQNYRTLKNMKE